jgi:hypothetical protein
LPAEVCSFRDNFKLAESQLNFFNILQPNNKTDSSATHCCPPIYNYNNESPKKQSKPKNQPKPQSPQAIVQRLRQQQQ